jgi:hypothetical protein
MVRTAILLLIFMLSSEPLWAVDGKQSAAVYNPSTKSYFQLFDDNPPPGTWEAARASATSKTYKGVRGRLAVIGSMETHKFIMQNFGLKWREASVWIGLRYWCSVRMLQWEHELPYAPTDASRFRMWHSDWSRGEGETCGMDASKRKGYAGVYYRNIGGTVRWQAVGAGKGFVNYLVEYVTNGQ